MKKRTGKLTVNRETLQQLESLGALAKGGAAVVSSDDPAACGAFAPTAAATGCAALVTPTASPFLCSASK